MLRWIDGFEAYTAASDATTRYEYANLGVSQIITGRAGYGQALKFIGVQQQNSSFITPSLTNQATWVIGFAFNTQLTGPIYTLLDVRDSLNSQVNLCFNSNTSVFYITNNGITIATGNTILNTNVWYYIEFKTTIGNPGTYEVRINEVTDIFGTGVTKASVNTFANKFAFMKPATWDACYLIDDIYILDNTGSANNDFLGEVKTELLTPTGPGLTTQWTPIPGSLTNWQAVSGQGEVQTSTFNFVDVYAFGALQFLTGNIAGVAVSIYGEIEDITSHQLGAVIKSSGTTIITSPQTFADLSPRYKSFIQETDPSTSVAWTIGGINAAQYGMKLLGLISSTGEAFGNSTAIASIITFSTGTTAGNSTALAYPIIQKVVGTIAGSSTASGVGTHI